MSIGDLFMLLSAIALSVILAVGGMTLHKYNKAAAQKAAPTPSRTPVSILTTVAAWVFVVFVAFAAPRVLCSTSVLTSTCSFFGGTTSGAASGTKGNKQVAAAFVAYHQGIDAVWDRVVGGTDRSRAQRLSARAMQELGESASLATAAGAALALGLLALLVVAGFNSSAFAKRWHGWLRVAVIAFGGAGIATPLFGVVVLNLVGSISPDLTVPGWYMGLGLGLAATLLLVLWPIEVRLPSSAS